MKNLHERLTKNLGRRLLIGVFFIFLGMTPAIYIWSCVPNNKQSPNPQIPPTPIPMSVSNIEFNTKNDYLYDYYRTSFETSSYNKYISLKDNQYIYYDTENKINFINSDSKITPIENQKVAKAIGEFNNKNVIVLNSNDNFKLGLIGDKNIEYIDIPKLDLDFSRPIYITQSSETTFNLVFNNKNWNVKLLQFDSLTKNSYIHKFNYWKDVDLSSADIKYQNGVIVIGYNYESQEKKETVKLCWTVANDKVIANNDDIVLELKDLYVIKSNYTSYKLAQLTNNIYDYKKIDKDKIKILLLQTDTQAKDILEVDVFDKEKQVYTNFISHAKDISYLFNYYVVYSQFNQNKITKLFYFGDLLTDDYKYLVYQDNDSYVSVSENNLYIIDYTNGYLNIKYYDVFSKKMLNKEFKNIKDIKLSREKINFNNFYIYQGNYYFNIYENSTLKVFTNDNNIANINIDKYKITRYKNNLVVLTKDKCLLLNLDSKNTTEFNLKDFDFDNYNSEFINANFDKNNILFKNNNTIQLLIFKL